MLLERQDILAMERGKSFFQSKSLVCSVYFKCRSKDDCGACYFPFIVQALSGVHPCNFFQLEVNV